LLRVDQRLEVLAVAEVTGTGRSTAHDLSFYRVAGRWDPRKLAEEHSSETAAPPFANLCHYQDEGEFCAESDGTWAMEHGFIPDSESKSVTWKHLQSPTKRKNKIKNESCETKGHRFVIL
jgi:hypothetical protein